MNTRATSRQRNPSVFFILYSNNILYSNYNNNCILIILIKIIIFKLYSNNMWASQVAIVGKRPPSSVGDRRDLGWIPGLEGSRGGRHNNPLQCSCLENPHGQRSLVVYSPQGHKDSDMLKWLSTQAIITCSHEIIRNHTQPYHLVHFFFTIM